MVHKQPTTLASEALNRTDTAPVRLRKMQGFSLVEVLISILVLTFGLLGMVGMQAAALQANREARLQSSAVTLARELAEMIRGNKITGVLATNNPYIGSFSTPLTPATASYCLNVNTSTAVCANAVEIAQAQMTEWLARVDTELPGARVDICSDATPFDVNGVPQWQTTACTVTSGANLVIKMGWTQGSLRRGQTGAAALDRATVPSLVVPVTAGSTF
jgi:type IV pilus assembly protein PilV